MNPIEQIIAWLNEPIIKTILLLAGGFILKKWPAFVNKAIPTATLILSLVITLLKVLFPGVDTGALQPAVYHAAAFDPDKYILLPVVALTILPAVAAVGLYSGVKNTVEWGKKFGWKLIHKIV